MALEFKPNIYPIMYWALAFGAVSGVALFLLNILSQYITFFWFPVFLIGLVWGGYKNYQKQKGEWLVGNGVSAEPQSAAQEFKQAVGDVFNASREMMAEQQAEAVQAQQEIPQDQQILEEEPIQPAAPSVDAAQQPLQPPQPPYPPQQNQ